MFTRLVYIDAKLRQVEEDCSDNFCVLVVRRCVTILCIGGWGAFVGRSNLGRSGVLDSIHVSLQVLPMEVASTWRLQVAGTSRRMC